jgi:hypothetical protein
MARVVTGRRIDCATGRSLVNAFLKLNETAYCGERSFGSWFGGSFGLMELRLVDVRLGSTSASGLMLGVVGSARLQFHRA